MQYGSKPDVHLQQHHTFYHSPKVPLIRNQFIAAFQLCDLVSCLLDGTRGRLEGIVFIQYYGHFQNIVIILPVSTYLGKQNALGECKPLPRKQLTLEGRKCQLWSFCSHCCCNRTSSTMWCSCLISFKSHLCDVEEKLQKDQHIGGRAAAGHSQTSHVTSGHHKVCVALTRS